jgi:hypothetical protein
MRSLTKAPIVVAGMSCRGDGWGAGATTASARESETQLRPNGNPAPRRARLPILEGESSREGRLAFRPTKEDTHASPVSPGQSGNRLGTRGLELPVVALPQGRAVVSLGMAVWRDALRRTPRWRRFAVRWRFRQQPTAAMNSGADDGTPRPRGSRLGSVLSLLGGLFCSRFPARATPWTRVAVPRARGCGHGSRLGRLA